MYFLYCYCQHFGNAELDNLLAFRFIAIQLDGVCDEKLLYWRSFEIFNCFAGENAVGASCIDATSSVFFQSFRHLDQAAAGVNDVVIKNGGLTGNITDDIEKFRFVVIAHSSFIANCQCAVQSFGKRTSSGTLPFLFLNDVAISLV